MKFSSILALAVTITAANAYTIPLDIEPGVYSISLDDNSMVNYNASSILNDTSIGKRDSFPGSVKVGCEGNYLDSCPEHSAWQGLVGWCTAGAGVDPHSIRMWIDNVGFVPSLFLYNS
jgi:hypothetical protein